eukprot:1056550-Amphidinium_carterae.1
MGSWQKEAAQFYPEVGVVCGGRCQDICTPFRMSPFRRQRQYTPTQPVPPGTAKRSATRKMGPKCWQIPSGSTTMQGMSSKHMAASVTCPWVDFLSDNYCIGDDCNSNFTAIGSI